MMSRFLLLLLFLGASNYVSANDLDTASTETPVKLQCQPNEYQDDCPSDCSSDECPKGPVESPPRYSKTPTNKEDCPPPKCRCNVNHRRAKNGTCIDIRKCPPFDCSKKPNEEYVACPLPVCSDSCARATSDGKCHIFGRIGILLTCNPQCRCIKNYWRKDGVCVPYAECDKKETVIIDSPAVDTSKSKTSSGDDNIASPDTSAVKETESETKSDSENSSTSNLPAVEVSKRETSSDDDSNNASTSNSSAFESSKPETPTNDGKLKLECPPNEVQDDCPRDCEPEYCAKTREEAQPRSCVTPNQEKCPPPKCKCGFNQRRLENGTCISVYKCPAFECNGPYEEYVACPSYCPGESCESATIDGNCSPLFISLIVVTCRQSCRCIKNYWRKDGVCVPYAECGKGNKKMPVIVKPNEGKRLTFIQTDNNDEDTRDEQINSASSSRTSKSSSSYSSSKSASESTYSASYKSSEDSSFSDDAP
ncbi:uncharacterized protein LOC126366616 [Pectinophora gossypiella]|uniref:uncharacterized protein LOC126366616 n=1 Tax=Pectinophora gossypiella TaxID=13191 RepID=UPI00214DFF73|nr:uncharacterized protein LOC126366616 [Pectinophora gossypiella]